MSDKTSFGEILREFRINRRLSQEELAKILGTSKQVISRYENNLRTPKITVVADYAEKLKLEPGYFIDGKNHSFNAAEKARPEYAALDSGRRELLEKVGNLSDEDIKELISRVERMTEA